MGENREKLTHPCAKIRELAKVWKSCTPLEKTAWLSHSLKAVMKVAYGNYHCYLILVQRSQEIL